MSVKKYQVIYPGKVRIKEDVYSPSSVSKRKLKQLVELETNKGEVYTYTVLDNSQVSLLIYPELSGVYEENIKWLVPITEFCKAHYIKNGLEGFSIYVHSETNTVVTVYEGMVKNYSRKLGDGVQYEKLFTTVKEIQKSAQIDGYESSFYLDEFHDCFSGEKIDFCDEAIIGGLTSEQLIKNPSYKSGYRSFASVFTFKDIKDYSKKYPTKFYIALALVIVVFAQYGYSAKSISALSAQNEIMLQTITALEEKNTASIEAIKKSLALSKEDSDGVRYMKIHPQDMTKIIAKINSISRNISSGNRDFYRGNKMRNKDPLMLDDKNLGDDILISKKPNGAKHFFCKVLITDSKSVTCKKSNGAVYKINAKWQKIEGQMVRYMPKKGYFETRKGGANLKTTLDMANRGF